MIFFFFFFEKFGYGWGTHAEVPQEYKYPKSIQYGYGSIFGVPVLHRSQYLVQTSSVKLIIVIVVLQKL